MHHNFSCNSTPWANTMGKQNLKNLANLGSWSNHKKLPTYRKSKKENKENVSNHVREIFNLTALTGSPSIGYHPSCYESQR
jgi:hypothetical protein